MSFGEFLHDVSERVDADSDQKMIDMINIIFDVYVVQIEVPFPHWPSVIDSTVERINKHKEST